MTMKAASQVETPVSDLGLSAYLLSIGYSIIRTDGPPNRRVFVFSSIPPEAIYGYYSGTVQVNPRAFLSALRDLKGLVAQGL